MQYLYSQMSRHDDDLGFDPFHETQKALAEMIEKEEQRTRLSQYHQHQQVWTRYYDLAVAGPFSNGSRLQTRINPTNNKKMLNSYKTVQ